VIQNKIGRQLNAVDWDFPVSVQGTTKTAHWYPGTFPPQLPATLIQAFTHSGEVVFDPWGGSGTSASEALRLGRKAWVADINPVGILSSYTQAAVLLLRRLSEGKLNLLLDNIRSHIDGSVEKDLFSLDVSSANENLDNLDEILEKVMSPAPSEILNDIRKMRSINTVSLKKWLHPKTLEEILQKYQGLINSSKNSVFHLIVEVMFSSNLRALSSQNKSWGHIADNCLPKEFVYKDTKSQLSKWLTSFERKTKNCILENSIEKECTQYWASLHDWNSTAEPKNKPKGPAQIIITSPPYGDAIDYLYAQKLSLYFFGYNDEGIAKLCVSEIGARRKRFKTDSREKWAEQLKKAVLNQVGYLTGPLITILPHKNHGRELGMNMMTEGLLDDGWKEVFRKDRSINQKKTRQSWTSIKQETVCIFSKG
jgi:hypothetical protein